MRNYFLLSAVMVIIAFATELCALSGTTGTPLGGMGTGYVTYVGDKFGVSGKLPPAAADNGEKEISSSGFYLFAGTTAKAPAKGVSENAQCPLQTVDFGTVGGVKFNLTAFGPYLPGDGKDNFQLATSPLALFDMTAVNSGTAAIDVAVAMEFANGGLLGGASGATVETGNQAISFSGSPDNAYLAVDCDGATPAFSAGAVGTFATDGKLANADGNLVAAKCKITAGDTVHFKFVLAWYRNFGTENYWYQNYYKNSKEAAEFGKSKFDAVRNGITTFVNRITASNFPNWYKDRLLNNTYPLIHNSQCAKDGRVAFWEGNYGIIGTIDQGQHAALFYTFNWPEVQWHELQYWKRSAKSTGQIHHDVNTGIEKFTAESDASRSMLAWDNKDHADYWWFPNTETWSDLNSMFIFKAYELMLATGDLDSMKLYLPAIIKTGERILSQCPSGSKLPSQSHSTYDQKDNSGTFGYTPEYDCGIAVTTYAVVSEIAKFCGDDATAATYHSYFTAAKTEFKQKYAGSSTFASVGRVGGKNYEEGDVAGYSWANYFCLEPMMDKDFITSACNKLQNGYNSKSSLREKLGFWVFYTVDHLGGSQIAIGNPDSALALHKLDYQYYYQSVPNMVFWQTLQPGDGNTHHDSYMTAPTVWRSYFQFCGYMLDNANKRLWIRPRIPTEMGGKITNAILLNPKALGTLNYEETPTANRRQTITIAYDAPMTVKEIVLKNNTGIDTPFVAINGSQAGITRKAEDWGIEKNIRVTLGNGIQIGPQGVKIKVTVIPEPDSTFGTRATGATIAAMCPIAINTSLLRSGNALHFRVDRGGPVTMELISLSGAKIGAIFTGSLSAGNHVFQWNGKTMKNGVVATGMALLRLSSLNGCIIKPVVIGK